MKEYIVELPEDNIIIHVGENAKDNWKLLDESNQNFIWFHLKNLTSPYVIINHSDPPKNVVNYAAALCKSHSKYNQIKKVNVIYTQVKNLRKADKEGSVYIKGKTKELCL
jgi:predicted ribosome quality control (RQC) complex YloA/Tae2 family protein